MNWRFYKAGKGIAGEYRLNGWTVFCDGSGWKVVRPDGYVYSVTFARIISAQRFAEGKMK